VHSKDRWSVSFCRLNVGLHWTEREITVDSSNVFSKVIWIRITSCRSLCRTFGPAWADPALFCHLNNKAGNAWRRVHFSPFLRQTFEPHILGKHMS
jgi:hypothetical protein